MKLIYILLISLLLICSTLAFAEEFSITTPDGSFSLKITGSDSFDDGKTDSGTLIDNIAMKLEELEKDYISKLARLDKARAERLISEIFALLALLPADTSVNIQHAASQQQTQGSSSINISMNFTEQGMTIQEESSPPPPPPPPPASEPVKNAMSEPDFSRFLDNVESESFSDDQLRIIRLASRDSWFMVSQIVRIIEVLSFSDDQLEALRIMYSRVTDPQNSHNIVNAFTFSSDKEDAERIMGK
jgi:hypothetical protein